MVAKRDVGASLEEATGDTADGPRQVPGGPPKPSGGRGRAVVLPTVPRPRTESFTDQVFFIYGPPKIGKSTLASEAGNVLFFEMEPGLRHLDVMTTGLIPDWEAFCDFVNAVRKPDAPRYDAFVIDTCDILAERCAEHCNAKQQILHEGELEYGRGYRTVRNELMRWVTKLAGVDGTGLILLAHSQERDIKTRSASYTRNVPTLSPSIRRGLLDLADVILFADFDDDDTTRVLRSNQSRYWEGGDRSSRLPDTIEWPKGGGWDVIRRAWEEGT